MNKKEAEEVFRWRRTLVDNIEEIILATKKSSKYDLSSQGQMDLFGAGLEVEKKKDLKEYSGYINIMDHVRDEMGLIGVPYTYNPLDGLDMYSNLYCTHDVTDILEFNENKSGVIVMDWITEITHHRSKEKGNPYVRIYTSLYGADKYWFLWGKDYERLISKVFINEVYLFELNYRIPTIEYSKESINITHLNNVKDVDINSEYERVYDASKEIKIDKKWIEANKPEWL